MEENNSLLAYVDDVSVNVDGEVISPGFEVHECPDIVVQVISKFLFRQITEDYDVIYDYNKKPIQ